MNISSLKPTLHHVQFELSQKAQLFSGHVVKNLKQVSHLFQSNVKVIYGIALAVLAAAVTIGHQLAKKIEEKDPSLKGYLTGSFAFGAVVLAGNLILKAAVNFPATKTAIAAIVSGCMLVRALFSFKEIFDKKNQLDKDLADEKTQYAELDKKYKQVFNQSIEEEVALEEENEALKHKKEGLENQLADTIAVVKEERDVIQEDFKMLQDKDEEIKQLKEEIEQLKSQIHQLKSQIPQPVSVDE